MNDSDSTIAFLPLDSKIGGQINYNRPSVGQFLTREQASYVYKKVESGKPINVDTIKHEMEQEEQLNKIDDMSGETNPNRELIVNNAEKVQPLMTQMEQWSIFSNVLNYIQHDRHPMINQNLSIKVINRYKDNSKKGRKRDHRIRLWCHTRDTMQRIFRYIWGNSVRNSNTIIFDENSDLSTTYLGKSDKT